MKQTRPFKDVAAKPAKGRYFALSFGEAASQTTKLGLMDADGNRVRIHFENFTERASDVFVFAAYRKNELLVLRSWEGAVAPAEAAKATLKALVAFAALRDEPVPPRNRNTSVWYATERNEVGELRFLQKTNHWQLAKYRGNDSLSSARSRLTKSELRFLPWPCADGVP